MRAKQGMAWLAVWIIPLGAPCPKKWIAEQNGLRSVSGVKISENKTYRMIQAVLSSGVQTKEYVDTNGIVFGVTWKGNTHPPMESILGEYYNSYEKGMQKYRRLPGHRTFEMEVGDLVVQKWGQMRQLQGRAFLKSHVPLGMEIVDLK